MYISETYQKIGRKRYEAAKFLIQLLSAGEKPSADVYLLAEERGIMSGTLKRAGRIIKAKSRKAGSGWFMSIPADAKERFEGLFKPPLTKYAMKISSNRSEIGAISTDWIPVTIDRDGVEKIEIPSYHPTKSGLRVRVGGCEIEFGEAVSAEKVAAILREMAVVAE